MSGKLIALAASARLNMGRETIVTHTIAARFIDGSGTRTGELVVKRLIIAGWTGRDPAAVEHHIRELEALAVKRPASTPIFYRVGAARLTQAAMIEASGSQSGGEVEFVIVNHDGELWVGVGSDHTDREVETYGVTVSKQMCDKPVARDFWRFSDVAGHWDKMILRSWVEEDGARKIYQEGHVAAMLDPRDLLKRFAPDKLGAGDAMFCGTLAAKGGVRPTSSFAFELEDPVLGRKIDHAYRVEILPVLG